MVDDGPAVRFRRTMSGRDVDEEHRGTTPLELLFDLCFVVAVSGAAAGLRGSLVDGVVGVALLKYLMVFFAIWWAWMNFTWFASAFDTDDVLYRLLVLVQMAGALILAAGVPAAFATEDYLVVTLGYTVMRLGMIPLWIRGAVEHPARRRTAALMATGLVTVQVLWLLRLALPGTIGLWAFLFLVVCELAVPVIAENAAGRTPWHPGHIADRYGCFTVITLGEVVLAATVSVQQAVAAHGLTVALWQIALGGLLLVFAMWWLYFKRSAEDSLRSRSLSPFAWGYGHYLVFCSVAAVGAAIGGLAESLGDAGVTHQSIGIVLAGAVAAYMVILAMMRLGDAAARAALIRQIIGAAVIVGIGAAGLSAGPTVLLVGLACASTLAWHLAAAARAGV